jgi:selenocysteine lyase/cysteine desulfurase
VSPPATARLGSREHFTELAVDVYANHAGISPASLPVRGAVVALLDDYMRLGAAAFPAWHEQRARLRKKLAALIGAEAADLGFTSNTTAGVIDVALCFPWQRGDRVIVFEGEFPANVTPWQRAAELFGLELVMLPLRDYERSSEEGLARLRVELARGARLVAVSAVQFQSGLAMPLGAMAELCHAHGAELFVDAVQAVGVVPLDVGALDVDYLACGSHKWLMGLEGAGFLYVKPSRMDKLRPTVAGWLGHEGGLRFLFEGPGHLRYDRPIVQRASLVEAGNSGAASLAALEASVDLIASLGVASIHAHVNAWHDLLEPELTARGFTSLRAAEPERRSGTLSVVPPSGHSVVQLQRALDRRGVACALPDGVLRFAPHWPNGLDEVPRVVRAIDESMAEA